MSTLTYVDVYIFLLIFWFYFMCFTDEHDSLPYVDVYIFLLIFWFYFMCFTDEHDWSRVYIT